MNYCFENWLTLKHWMWTITLYILFLYVFYYVILNYAIYTGEEIWEYLIQSGL